MSAQTLISNGSVRVSQVTVAVDLENLASALCASDLASLQNDMIVIAPTLAVLEPVANDEVLMAIARILLTAAPPPWLHASVGTNGFFPEYVPTTELDSLKWLGDSLEPILSDAKDDEEADDAFRSWLGSLGESLILSTERQAGADARQVSLISDHFGYDVDSQRDRRYRLEIKTSVVGSERRFFITRNEVNTAKKNPNEWFLVQVILKPEAVTAHSVTREHVHLVRQLDSGSLVTSVPLDSAHSRWIDSAEVSTENLSWVSYELVEHIPAQWCFKSMPRLSSETL
jgi:hypothetical protein